VIDILAATIVAVLIVAAIAVVSTLWPRPKCPQCENRSMDRISRIERFHAPPAWSYRCSNCGAEHRWSDSRWDVTAEKERMTEAEWNNCEDLQLMLMCFLDDVVARPELGLFGCACCRRVWSLLEDERSRIGVEAREGYLRGLVSEKELEDAEQNARSARRQIRRSTMLLNVGEESAESASAWAAGAAANAAVGNYHAASEMAARASACVADGDWQASYNSERAAQCELLREMITYPGM
jgi:hypothetical protein